MFSVYRLRSLVSELLCPRGGFRAHDDGGPQAAQRAVLPDDPMGCIGARDARATHGAREQPFLIALWAISGEPLTCVGFRLLRNPGHARSTHQHLSRGPSTDERKIIGSARFYFYLFSKFPNIWLRRPGEVALAGTIHEAAESCTTRTHTHTHFTPNCWKCLYYYGGP